MEDYIGLEEFNRTLDTEEDIIECAIQLEGKEMAKQYPNISEIEPRPKNTNAKCKCGAIGKFRVTVQVSWFRGEDEVLWACDDHKRNIPILFGLESEDG